MEFGSTDNFDIIQKIIENKERVKLTNNFTVNTTLNINRPYFSSTGLGSKGILKPDVYDHGSVIFSAKATNKTITSQKCEDIAIALLVYFFVFKKKYPKTASESMNSN